MAGRCLARDGRSGCRLFRPGPGLAWLAFSLAATGAESPSAAVAAPSLDRLRTMSLEEVLRTEVTSVTRGPGEWFDSAAAIHVITGEDYRRSGATSIPEALRLAPGLNVAQYSGARWAVAARGFNELFTDKLLVLVDGRSVFSSVNAGVWWNEVDYPPEDIERIEVIRGPGGALWGANAVNGVINIITKDAANTPGTYVTGSAGSNERAGGTVRHGFVVNDTLTGRIYARYRRTEEHPEDASGLPAFANAGDPLDARDFFQAGTRLDWDQGDGRLTLSADGFFDSFDDRILVPSYFAPYLNPLDVKFDTSGANARARYTLELGEGALDVQAYYDHVDQQGDTLGSRQVSDTVDIQAQHRTPLPGRQLLTYGLGYRYLPTSLDSTVFYEWRPNDRHQQLFSAFVQDELELVRDALRLTVGAKLEHNDFTGWEPQPNARLTWLPAPRHTLWTAVSHAVSVPMRNSFDTVSPLLQREPDFVDVPGLGTLPVFLGYEGPDDLDGQDMLGTELGWRWQAADNLLLDTAAFYNAYNDLRYVVPRSGPDFVLSPYPHIHSTITLDNVADAETAGVEVSAEYRPVDWCRLTAWYAYLYKRVDGADGAELLDQRKDPAHSASLRVSLDVLDDVQLDVWGRFVDELEYFPTPAYFDLDVRVGWRPKDWLEVAVVGQNLLDDQRPEFGPADSIVVQPTQVPRGVYGTVTFQF